MSEPQYQGYFEYPKEAMGVMASQYWRDDPKLLGIHLARYKFVSKMLAGKKFVAEIGCGDGWFSKVVRQEVDDLHLYDFDKRFIDAIHESGEMNAYCHDITKGTIEHCKEYGGYQGIYSLDVMEHILPKDLEWYLRNIADSLHPDGVAIFGMPSLESQKYASEASKIGHVGCLSYYQFKRELESAFKSVLVFGMSDETIHTGFGPMCHYLMGVCCGPRR